MKPEKFIDNCMMVILVWWNLTLILAMIVELGRCCT